jgi:hypothetical protein
MQFCRIDKRRMAQKWGEFSFIPKKKICPIEAVKAFSLSTNASAMCILRTDHAEGSP